MTQSELNFIQEALVDKVKGLINKIVSNERAVREYAQSEPTSGGVETIEEKPSKPKASSKKAQ